MEIHGLWLRTKERKSVIRQNKKLTQAKLAELSGIDDKHLSRIETGGSFPKADLIESFANILEVNPCELFVYDHFESKEELIQKINIKLENCTYKEIQSFYKIIKNL